MNSHRIQRVLGLYLAVEIHYMSRNLSNVDVITCFVSYPTQYRTVEGIIISDASLNLQTVIELTWIGMQGHSLNAPHGNYKLGRKIR